MPHLDEIELIGIGDEAARVNALLSGDVQLINAVSPRSTERIKGASGFTVLETKTGAYTDLIVRDEGGITGNDDFRRGMMYLLDREQIRRAVFRGYGAIGNDQPIDPTNKYYMAGLPQRALRSRQGQVPLPEGQARQRADADLRVAGGGRVGRNGDAAPAGRAAGRPEPAGDARAGRRLLVESLDEASAGLRQRQRAPERRRALHAVLQVRRAVERGELEEPEVRPDAGRRARRTGRREAQEDLRRHAGAGA